MNEWYKDLEYRILRRMQRLGSWMAQKSRVMHQKIVVVAHCGEQAAEPRSSELIREKLSVFQQIKKSKIDPKCCYIFLFFFFFALYTTNSND